MSPAPLQLKSPKDATPAHKVGKIGWITRSPMWVAGALALGLVSAGCATETTESRVEARVTTGSSSTKIFGGDKDDDSDALPGVVALRVGVGATFELCSG